MIYMEPSQLGWEPLVTSWMNTLPEALRGPDHSALIQELFLWLLPPTLRVLRKHCRVSDRKSPLRDPRLRDDGTYCVIGCT